MATGKNSTRKVSATNKTQSGARSKPPAKKPAAKPRKTTPRKRAAAPRLDDEQRSLLTGIIILFLTAILTLSLLSPSQGQFTQWLSGLAALGFGIGRLTIPLITGALGAFLILRGMEQEPDLPHIRLLGLAVVLFVFLASASIFVFQRDAAYTNFFAVAAAGKGGGYTGSLLATVLTRMVGDLGAIIILVAFGLAGMVLATGLNRDHVAAWMERTQQPADNTAAPSRGVRANSARTKTAEPAETIQPRLIPDNRAADRKSGGGAAPSRGQAESPVRDDKHKPPAGAPQRAFIESDSPPAAPNGTDGPIWILPRVTDILESGTDIDVNSTAIREQVEVIEQTLESFGAPVTVVEINPGPTLTQFGVEPNYVVQRGGKRTKVKVGKISGLADDLALALAARSIRIQAPVPGKGYVGIEVPNSDKALVSLRDVIESAEYSRIKSPLRIGLGQNVAGKPVVADLAAMPHLLIAGTTGSGKSVCVNGVIACLLLQNTPDDLRLVMIDPKRVELTGYNGIPHLAAPVVVDMDRVIGTLQWALREMDNRYKLFSGAGARNISEYNKKIRRDSNTIKLPYIVIVIDELADLMMLAPEDTERSITRLAQMARATGIHMVIATQRPSVDVVTGLIKANFPARIAFAVASGTDSRVILDTTGAERLLGQGDMLFQSPDAAAAVRLQGCFVSDLELHQLISYWQTARQSQMIYASGKAPTAGGGPTRPGRDPVVLVDPTGPEPSGRRPAEDVPPPVSNLNPPEPAPNKPAPQQRAPQIPTERPAASAWDLDFNTPEPPTNHQRQVSDDVLQQPLWEALQEAENSNGDPLDGSDELLPEAIALVRSLNKASTSLLQRRFRIGYTRAARLMDVLEDQGIIGPPTGTSKAREVYPADDAGVPDETVAE